MTREAKFDNVKKGDTVTLNTIIQKRMKVIEWHSGNGPYERGLRLAPGDHLDASRFFSAQAFDAAGYVFASEDPDGPR
jgi:hypothetical protein